MTKRFFILFALLLFTVPGLTQETTPEPEADIEVITTREAAPDASTFTLVEVISGLRTPLFATGSGDGSNRLFVVEQTGRIWIIENDILNNMPFIDLSDIVSQDVLSRYSERGLLGLAFHPNFAENGHFFVNYTNREGTSVVARYTVSAEDPNVADPNSAITLLTLGQPYANHNGGHMAFSPNDGYLYISFGDGGAADDPLSAGQNPATWLGTILRIDVDTDGSASYLIPDDNPYTVDPSLAREVWAYGLRNVWRFSFDRATGDMYLGDVGQNAREEINFQPADSPGGENYGWPAYEATTRYIGPDVANVVMPVAEYTHSVGGCSITAGYAYRGQAIPSLQGYFLYSDYCSGLIWAAYRNAEGNWNSGIITETGRRVSSFGQDDSGELYVIDYSGSVLRIEPVNHSD